MQNSLIEILKIVVFTSVIFVWCIRYKNIIEEFKNFGYPAWFRDVVGILKISFVIMIISSDYILVQVGSLGIVFFMIGAIMTHLKIKNHVRFMAPSMCLLLMSSIIFLSTLD